ncbi:hypothetical protein ABG067_004225 [Albugo candida]
MLLVCMLVGVAGNVFSVEADDHKIVDTVKDEIKKKKPNAVKCDADELELYLAKRNGVWLTYASDDVEWLSEGETTHVQDLIEGKGLPPVESIIDVFHGINDALRVIHKRKWADLKEYIVPSAFGSYKAHNGFVATREKYKGQIQCHRPDDSNQLTNLIPIVLLNETFIQFDYNCQHIDIGKADFDFVAELCEISSTPSEDEADSADE